MMNILLTKLRMSRVCGLLLVTSLAACGGSSATTPSTSSPSSSGPTNGTTTTTIPTPSADNGTPSGKRQQALNLINNYAPSAPINYTALGSVPTSGTATYDGYFFGDIAGINESIIGDLSVTATFNASSLSLNGSVTNIFDGDDKAATGSLTVNNGALNRSGNPNEDATLTATVQGNINAGGRSIVLGAQMEGDFIGSTYNAIGGEALGTATVNGTARDFDGGFIAGR